MDLLKTLQLQIDDLALKAEEIDLKDPVTTPQDWFESTIFTTHSIHLADYVEETRKNVNYLYSNQRLTPTFKHKLVEKISSQIDALNRAFNCKDTRQKFYKSKPQKVNKLLQKLHSPTGNQLYALLNQYMSYEQRLKDMIEAERRHPSQDTAARSIALHARLGRCRKAIYEVECKIQKLEQRGWE